MLKNTLRRYCSEGGKVNQVLMSGLTVLPVFSYGTAVGWLSPNGPRLGAGAGTGAGPVSPAVVSWMAAVPFLVATPAVFAFGHAADRCGRKPALMVTSLALAMCWCLKLCSAEPWALLAARAAMGLGVSGAYVVTPLYIKEISEDSVRGTLGTLVILSQNLGNLAAYVAAECLSYRAALWLCLAVPTLHLLAFCRMPDTPSYLLKCGKVEQAAAALAWLRRRAPDDPAVAAELAALAAEQGQGQRRFLQVLRTVVSDKPAFRAFRITLTITLAREMCGCLAVLHFAAAIFAAGGAGGAVGGAGGGGFALTPDQQAAVLGAVQLAGSCAASTLVERTGRKPLLGTTCLLTGAAMFALGVWFRVCGDGRQPWAPVTALCLCVFCDAAGLQPVPFVIMTEIFPFQYRGVVTSLVIATACALVSVQLRAFHPLAAALGLHMVFWAFAGVCAASTLYIALCVPETKMKTIEEIYEKLGGEKRPKSVVTRL